jgi:hypothetical protein
MTIRAQIRSIGFSAALFFVAMLNANIGSADSRRIYRCESDGKITYSDVACTGKPEAVEVDTRLNTFTAEDPPRIETKGTSKQFAGPRASDSIAEEQARHKLKCNDIANRIDVITRQLWSDGSLRSRSNRAEKLRAQQAKLESERRTYKCH